MIHSLKLTNYSKLVLFTLFWGLLSGCAPSFFRYHYINIEESQFNVTQKGTANLDGYSLIFHDEMPVEYEYRSENFVIKAILDQEGSQARIKFGVLSLNTEKLQILGVFNKGNFGIFSEPGEEVYNFPIQKGEIAFLWSCKNFAKCDMKSPPHSYKSYFTLEISEIDGKLIEKINVPFRITTNGIFIGLDAI